MRAKDLNVDTFLARVAGICNYARQHGWKYGDSHAIPPCSDGKISCDRVIARALWDLGFVDQRVSRTSTSGITVGMFDEWLTAHGWIKSTSYKDAKRGSIVVVKNNSNQLHTFVINDVNLNTWVMSRYDTGSDYNIQYAQPMTTSLNLYPRLVALYNLPKLSKTVKWKGVVANCNSVFIRQWAGKNYDPLKSQRYLKAGEEVSVLDEICTKDLAQWYYVKTSLGKHGFVKSTYIVHA